MGRFARLRPIQILAVLAFMPALAAYAADIVPAPCYLQLDRHLRRRPCRRRNSDRFREPKRHNRHDVQLERLG